MFINLHVHSAIGSLLDSILTVEQAVKYAAAVGLATNCTITQDCKFDRKNYFYPDNPQNYQISQLYLPICRNGHVDVTLSDGTEKTIRIHEIHMEEDAGKLVHDEWEGVSYVDYNRSGVPLIEIVSEPDMRFINPYPLPFSHISVFQQHLWCHRYTLHKLTY